MVFNSFAFVYFFLLVYPVYLCLTHKAQNLLLLAASYVFYGFWDWRFLALLGITTVVDYTCARGMGDPKERRLLLGISLAVNLGMLAYFKYCNFFADGLVDLLGAFGLSLSKPALDIVLPAGISFYTFQSMSYVIDVYRGKVPAETNLLTFALFVAFFPHLVAGPIMRADTLLPQVKTPRVLTGRMLEQGLWLILFGYFKKTVVADNLAPFVARMRHPGMLSGGELLAGCYCMAFFLYTDFAGYSDIARGIGKLMGFELTNNFRMPLFANNPPDFWRRWHITLSDWFRDYVFAPLVRLKDKADRSAPYMLGCAVVTLVLCGLWHGASWNFVAFGGYHAALMVGFYAARPGLKKFWSFSRLPGWLRNGIANIGFFHLVSAAAIFFLIPKPSDWLLLGNGILHGAYDFAARPMVLTLLAFVVPMAIIEAGQEISGDVLCVPHGGKVTRLVCYSVVFAYILLAGATESHAFVYFQF